MFKNWDWYDTWMAVGLLVVALLVTLVGTVAVSQKDVDYYYLSSISNGGLPVMCVYAHWTWHQDERAYCTDDKDKALDFTAKANSTLSNRGK